MKSIQEYIQTTNRKWCLAGDDRKKNCKEKEKRQEITLEMGNIRFDDPETLAGPSRIFISVMRDLELLDYARRYFERKGDSSSIQRAQEIRKFYKQIIRDYVYVVRSIIPEHHRGSYKTIL